MSSVIGNFGPMRAAARAGLNEAGAEPVMVEDFPALNAQPRNACLDGVESCDGLLVIVGERGGEIAPSGKLIVEEEYEEAKRLGLPVWVFLQNVSRDADADRLAASLSDYIDGRFRVTFDQPEELSAHIVRAVTPWVKDINMSVKAPADVVSLVRRGGGSGSPTIRVAIVPARQADFEEWIDRQKERDLFEIAHRAHVFSYQQASQSQISVSAISLLQQPAGQFGAWLDRIDLTETGCILVESRVDERDSRNPASFFGFVIASETLADRIKAAFQFAREVYDEADPFVRHRQFFYAVAIDGFDMRSIESNPVPSNPFGFQIRPREMPMLAYPDPQVLVREQLKADDLLATKLVNRLKRQLEAEPGIHG